MPGPLYTASEARSSSSWAQSGVERTEAWYRSMFSVNISWWRVRRQSPSALVLLDIVVAAVLLANLPRTASVLSS